MATGHALHVDAGPMTEGTVLLLPHIPAHTPQTLPHLLLGVYYKIKMKPPVSVLYPLYYPLSKLVIVSFYV